MDLGLDGRTVIVTGASGGLGREIARAFAAEGADVVLTYHRSPAEAERVAKEIGERSLVVPYAMDDADSARALVDATLGWTGRIDVLVNNAVTWARVSNAADVGDEDLAADAPFEAVPDEDWLPVLHSNIDGAVRLSRMVAPVMRERRWGRLVHISSSLAVDGMAGSEYYGAAKAALHGFSRSVAFSLGQAGDILSNVVMPGLTRTDTNAAIADAYGGQFSALAPIGRLLDAAEVAGPIVYLGSAANTGVTGQVLAVTGGT
jgi:3-oxoacyl-[acyl-carrier protein] reductase